LYIQYNINALQKVLPYCSSLVTKPHQIRLSQVCNGNCMLIQQWPVLTAQIFQNTYL